MNITSAFKVRPPLSDDDPMPFGKWKFTPMHKVPASYLMYLWGSGLDKESGGVADYIRANKERLEDEEFDEDKDDS